VTEIIHIIYTDIIAKIAADDGTVVNTHRHSQVMEFEIIGFQFANADESMKFTVADQFGVKMSGNKYPVPVIRCIAVAYESLYFLSGQLPVFDTVLVLCIAEIVFVFALWDVLFIYKAVAKIIDRVFLDDVHAIN